MYQEEMHANLGFFATWLPGDHVEVGDIGILQAGRFRKQGSLRELEPELTSEREGSPQSLQYTSKSGTKVNMTADANSGSVIDASARIDIEFSQQGAFLFHAFNVQRLAILDRLKLSAGVIEAHERGQWDLGWHIVESVYKAECATVIVSEDDSAAITIRAAVKGNLGPVPLANADARLNVSSTKGRMLQILAKRDLRPLYSCIRVKETWLSGPRMVPVRGQLPTPEQLPFARPRLSELLES